MARRLLSIVLLFLYLIPSIGVNGSVHYCGGELAAIVIVPSDEHPCPCGPCEEKEGCCSDKAFSIKLNDNHKNADTKLVIPQFNDYIITQKCFHCKYTISTTLDKRESYRIKEKEPPDIPLFMLYQSFLI